MTDPKKSDDKTIDRHAADDKTSEPHETTHARRAPKVLDPAAAQAAMRAELMPEVQAEVAAELKAEMRVEMKARMLQEERTRLTNAQLGLGYGRAPYDPYDPSRTELNEHGRTRAPRADGMPWDSPDLIPNQVVPPTPPTATPRTKER